MSTHPAPRSLRRMGGLIEFSALTPDQIDIARSRPGRPIVAIVKGEGRGVPDQAGVSKRRENDSFIPTFPRRSPPYDPSIGQSTLSPELFPQSARSIGFRWFYSNGLRDGKNGRLSLDFARRARDCKPLGRGGSGRSAIDSSPWRTGDDP
jgi:hypothetical protein